MRRRFQQSEAVQEMLQQRKGPIRPTNTMEQRQIQLSPRASTGGAVNTGVPGNAGNASGIAPCWWRRQLPSSVPWPTSLASYLTTTPPTWQHKQKGPPNRPLGTSWASPLKPPLIWTKILMCKQNQPPSPTPPLPSPPSSPAHDNNKHGLTMVLLAHPGASPEQGDQSHPS